MGINNSKNIKKSTSLDTLNLPALNQKDIELIRTSWNMINRKEDLGISIMVRIFQEHKEIKNKWIFATNLETEAEMISNSQLRYHAKKIMDVMTRVILKFLNTNNPEEFSIEEFDLTRLGRNHFHYGVRREHFYYFEESLIYSIRKHTTSQNSKFMFDNKMEKSWHKLFWTMVNKIVEGIELEEKENLCIANKKLNEEHK